MLCTPSHHSTCRTICRTRSAREVYQFLLFEIAAVLRVGQDLIVSTPEQIVNPILTSFEITTEPNGTVIEIRQTSRCSYKEAINSLFRTTSCVCASSIHPARPLPGDYLHASTPVRANITGAKSSTWPIFRAKTIDVENRFCGCIHLLCSVRAKTRLLTVECAYYVKVLRFKSSNASESFQP